MNADAQRIAPAPICRSLTVRAPQAKAFDTFVAGMGRWWLKGHSLLASPQADVIVEPRAEGRWYEVGEDGSEQPWGRVIAFEPPERVVLAWQLNADWRYDPDFETIVEVRFTAEGEDTRVEFEHRGLEAFGARATGIRGDYESGMDGGWGELLGSYRRVADGD